MLDMRQRCFFGKGLAIRILRWRRGSQADHSSSSRLFCAAGQRVGAEGQAIAHRLSSRAEVGKRTARYLKWGESDLSFSAYKALLEKHYDVMVSESYGWWSMLIAVPKTAEMQRLLTRSTMPAAATTWACRLWIRVSGWRRGT